MRKTSPIADVVMHPVRLRIVQQLGEGRRVTTSDLRDALPDVAQATLYRHIAALVDAGIVAVVDERRVRGAVERTFALGDRMAHVDHDELREMGERELQQSFLTFLAHLGEDFDRASAGADFREFLGFGQVRLHVGTDDLSRIQAGLGELLAPYLAPQVDDEQGGASGRRTVMLSTVLMPDPADQPAPFSAS
ncbi:helix-turn-helix domain-containing protein [Agromyces sp. H3Y2-19a]|uniref:helix-turn-helix domain-containing protein n=1 Tax=Agromyces TaxID=33877 RepID=UPI001E564178|nr:MULTISPECIES: helix-turn-helix domain-containing protein [Agromyces]MCD5345891.1 helix-turn-helix domain-containing protein [Agromyces sp. S2-1-8]MDF0512259.1 helix-turn-helix domain-containing protein [Agromyces chromiiresistens]